MRKITIFKSIVVKVLVCSFFLIFTNNTLIQAQSWTDLAGGMNDWVYATTMYNGELIAGGKFTSAGGVSANHIARWDGTSWHPLGSGVNGKVNCMMVFGGKLYVGGEFTIAGGQTSMFIARWNGTSWSNIAGDMNNIVTSFAVYNNKLIVGGYFTEADGNPFTHIAAWSGNDWFAVGSGTGGTQGQVMALEVWNNQLVAGGFFTSAGGVSANHIAKWNGTSWSSIGSGISGIVYSLANYNSNLVAGGLFLSAGGVSANHIAQWDGTSWSAFGTGMSGVFYQYVFALTTYNGKLIAGGYFTNSGGVTTNGIAQWDGASWSGMGGGFFYPANVMGAHCFCLYGTSLIVGGLFYSAGATNTAHIARWYENSNPLSISLTGTNAICQDSYNGSIDLTVTGGTPPYTYSWSTGDSTQDINALPEGWYDVSVTDSDFTTEYANIYIGYDYSLPTPTLMYTSPLAFCPGDSVVLYTDSFSSYLWSNGATTSSITVDTSDMFYVYVTDSNGCSGYSPSEYTFSDSSNCISILNLRMFIEGYYIGSQTMTSVMLNQGDSSMVIPTVNDVDIIIAFLIDPLDPANIIDASLGILQIDGNVQCTFQYHTGSYYLGILHRNALMTWSKFPIPFVNGVMNYDFTTSASKAYGDNMTQVDSGVWAFYSGDIIWDENIDLMDASEIDNDINNFNFGYLATDINGDGNVDLLDPPIIDMNINNFVFSSHP